MLAIVMDNKSDILQQKKGGKPKAKWIAVVVALVMIVAGVAIVVSLRTPSPPATPSVSGTSSISTGQTYNFTINAKSPFSTVNVYFGDGTETTVPYNGSTSVVVHHIYNFPGTGYIYYEIHYSNGFVYSSSSSLQPITVIASTTYLSQYQSLGSIVYNTSASSPVLIGGQQIFAPGSFVNFTFGYYEEPLNKLYAVVGQSISVSTGQSVTLPYSWSSTTKEYTLSPKMGTLNETFPNSGLYVFAINTLTAQVNATTGNYSPDDVYMSTNFFDIAVFSNGNIVSVSTTNTFVDAMLESGSYKTLDPIIADDSVSSEIIKNVYQDLFIDNGSSTTSFSPELISHMPSVSNGGINTNYKNYTVTDPWGTTYAVNVTPYENYTFHIRTNATFQNGQPVTAWDAMYSFTRALLFDAASPSTSAWKMAQYVLPGDYYKTNTFWNITQNMTVNNATNDITIHIQKPISSTLFFQSLGAAAFVPMDVSWLIANGAGITWSPAGFQAYKVQGSESNYNTYIQNNVMGDGPYKIAYIIPSTEVVLKPNPAFNPPGPWYPRPSIDTIILQYTGSPTTTYLELKSGEAQSGGIPTSEWYLVQGMEKAGTVKTYSYPSLAIFWYNFNANVNTTMLHTIYSTANVPSALFTSLNARRAFAYAYDYNYYLNAQVGNQIYNTTFGSAYAGLLGAGMPGYQSISQLNNTTTGVPYFDLAMAASYWHKIDFAKYGITNTSSGYTYGGSPLVIPIIIDTGDPTDLAGATTWGGNLETFITGATFPVIPTSFPNVISYEVQGRNPMPIYASGWTTLIPYPTDRLGPIGLPQFGIYPKANDFSPSYFASVGHNNQSKTMASMILEYANATSTTNQNTSFMWFHKMNQQFVNLTFDTYLYQEHNIQIFNSAINGNSVIMYQENPTNGGLLYFNLLNYNSTATG